VLNVIADAIVFSNLLALMALGITLTYMTVKVANFAHGDFATVGIYFVYTLFIVVGVSQYFLLPFAFLMGGLVASLSYFLVFKPLVNRGVGSVGLMIASIAMDMIIRSFLHIYSDIMQLGTKKIFRGFIFQDFVFQIYNWTLPGILVVSTILSITLILSLHLLLTKTKMGIAMRAAIENPNLAEVLGVNVNLVYAISWFIAGGLAGIAGALLPFTMVSDPEIGWQILLRVFAASILGGLSSLYGAILGGYIVGFAETLGIYFLSKPPFNISTAYRPAISFMIIILCLLIIPEGIVSVKISLKMPWRRKQ